VAAGPLDIPADFIAGGIIVGTLVTAEAYNCMRKRPPMGTCQHQHLQENYQDAPIYVPPADKIIETFSTLPPTQEMRLPSKKTELLLSFHHVGQSPTGHTRKCIGKIIEERE